MSTLSLTNTAHSSAPDVGLSVNIRSVTFVGGQSLSCLPPGANDERRDSCRAESAVSASRSAVTLSAPRIVNAHDRWFAVLLPPSQSALWSAVIGILRGFPVDTEPVCPGTPMRASVSALVSGAKSHQIPGSHPGELAARRCWPFDSWKRVDALVANGVRDASAPREDRYRDSDHAQRHSP